MMKFTIKDYIIIFITFILFMAFLCLYYVGGPAIRLALKYIVFGFLAGSISMFILMAGKEN